MTDALKTGAERLVAMLSEHAIGMDEQLDSIVSDPGVKAKHAFVLHFAEMDCCCEKMERLLRDLFGPGSQPFKCYSCLARAALKLWEHGDD